MAKKHSQGIQHHLRELEAQIGQISATNSQPHTVPAPSDELANQPTHDPLPEPAFPGTIQVNKDGQDGTRYVDSTHWQAVLHQVGRCITQ